VSARAFAGAGFPALATSSSAVAATLGYADGGGAPPDEMFAAVARTVRAVGVPVTADVERGYGLAPREIAERLPEAGAVGCNPEDSGPAARNLSDPVLRAERPAALRAAAETGAPVSALCRPGTPSPAGPGASRVTFGGSLHPRAAAVAEPAAGLRTG
jgi:2-methylisocitrate lyase-like PEP mutase family enzyme